MKPLPMGRCVKTLTLEVRIRSQDKYYTYLPYLCTRSRTIIQVKVNFWPLTPFPFIYYTVLFRLHPHNVLGIRSFGDQYMCTNLVDATNKYLQKHFKDVMKSEEFYNLSVTDIQDIICRDELNIESEEQVLLFFVWWSWVFSEGDLCLWFYRCREAKLYVYIRMLLAFLYAF